MRILVNSIPKSGTYLCANLLSLFGFENTYLHLSPSNRYVKLTAEEIKNQRQTQLQKIGIKEALSEILDNQVVLAHIGRTPEHVDLFKDYKKIILHRTKEEVIESLIRWREISGVPYDVNIIEDYMWDIKLWGQEANTIMISFDDLVQKNAEVIDALQQFLFGSIRYDSMNCIEEALAMHSYTKSSIRN